MKIQEILENKRNRRIAIWTTIITTFGLIVVAVIGLYGNNSPSSGQKIDIKDNRNSPVARDIQTQNNYYYKDSDSSKIKSTTPELHDQTLKKTEAFSKKTFALYPLRNTKLQNLFLKNNLLLNKINPTYNIEITFSGEIEKVAENLYRYNGGSILAKINEKNCCEFKDLKISATFYGGNNKEQVLNDIKENIQKLILGNEIKIYNKIDECLN